MSKPKGFFAGSRVAKAAPPPTLPQCGACKLHRGCRSPKFPVVGDGNRRVLFVGEAPAAEEDKQGTQLIGQADKRLARTLRATGFDLERDAWKTNAIICRPPKGRQPATAEVAYCRPNLDRIIKELQPDVVVPLGIAATNAVIGNIWKEDGGAMGRWAGWAIPCQELNAWVCPTWHSVRDDIDDDPVLERQYAAHLKHAVGLEGKPWPQVPRWADDVRIVTDPGKAAAWLRKAATMATGAVAWDYECNMLKPDGPDARIVSCSVAWGREVPERCIAFPWHGEAITAMGELLRSPVPKIASNLKFEDRWTRMYFGHRVRAWAWDTMLAAHVADNRSGITSVKFQAFVRLGVPVWNKHIEPFLKTKGDDTVNQILREIELKDLLLYNGLDSLLEFRVAVHQQEELNYPRPWKV